MLVIKPDSFLELGLERAGFLGDGVIHAAVTAAAVGLFRFCLGLLGVDMAEPEWLSNGEDDDDDGDDVNQEFGQSESQGKSILENPHRPKSRTASPKSSPR